MFTKETIHKGLYIKGVVFALLYLFLYPIIVKPIYILTYSSLAVSNLIGSTPITASIPSLISLFLATLISAFLLKSLIKISDAPKVTILAIAIIVLFNYHLYLKALLVFTGQGVWWDVLPILDLILFYFTSVYFFKAKRVKR